jgi:hypothetical protein
VSTLLSLEGISDHRVIYYSLLLTFLYVSLPIDHPIEQSENVFCGTSCVISNAKSLKKSAEDDKTPTVVDYASKHKPELIIVELPLP